MLLVLGWLCRWLLQCWPSRRCRSAIFLCNDVTQTLGLVLVLVFVIRSFIGVGIQYSIVRFAQQACEHYGVGAWRLFFQGGGGSNVRFV